MSNAVNSKPIDKYIPWMFVAFFMVVAVVDAIFVTMAIRTHPGVVTERHYEKGLDYNNTLAAEAEQKAMGWQGAVTYKNGVLRLTLGDKAGKPVSNGAVRASVMRPARKDQDKDLVFKNIGQGVYEADIVFPLSGQWRVHVFVTAGTDKFQMVETLNVQ